MSHPDAMNRLNIVARQTNEHPASCAPGRVQRSEVRSQRSEVRSLALPVFRLWSSVFSLLASLPLLLGLAGGAQGATLPFVEPFEDRSSADLHDQYGWQTSPTNTVTVQESTVYAGSKAASVLNTAFWHSFDFASTNTNVWVDCVARVPRRQTSTAPSPGTNSAASFYLNSNGLVVVMNTNTWQTCNTFTAAANQWVRFTVNLNYGTERWSLFASDATTNKLATIVATNLSFKSRAVSNSYVSTFRVNASNSLTTGYIDNITVAEDGASGRPLNVDLDADLMADRWEMVYFGSTTNSSGGTNDWDHDGWTDWQEWLAGTHPTNASSFMRISTLDLSSPTSSNIDISFYGGSYSATGTYAADVITRSFVLTVANNDASNSKVLAGGRAGTFTDDVNTWTDTNAAALYTNRFYYLSASMGGVGGYTNLEEWAMFRQNRTAGQRYLICVPVDFTNTTLANLNSSLGQQLARGLYGASIATNSDRISFLTGPYTHTNIYWMTNALGQGFWSANGGSTTADVPFTPGMAVWVYRTTNWGVRTNAVFTGKTFTEYTITNLSFRTNYGGWNMFGWALSTNRWHRNSGVGNTASNQLGIEMLGTGGTTTDPNQTNQLGDQLWVWKDNTWKKWFWLMDNHTNNTASTNFSHRWYDANLNQFMNYPLEPGVGYYYWHTTNWAATNFYWTPDN